MSQTIGACDLVRGVGRALTAAGQTVLAELPLGNGRRADLAAIDRAGAIILVEIKSCRADYQADRNGANTWTTATASTSRSRAISRSLCCRNSIA